MKSQFSRVFLTFVILLSCQYLAEAQDQDGGVNAIFHRGVGARQMALGGAVVAYPQDPTTIYWNPAGMEYLSEKSVSLFYTTFLEGTSFNFVGVVYPTLYIGTFGAGIARIANSGIIERGTANFEDLGEFDYDQSEFYLSYAKIIRNFVSIGASVKLERQSIGSFSDAGVGFDLSFMYLPNLNNDYLRNMRFGLNIQNAVAPKLNPGDATDRIPTRLLLGVARPFYLGLNRNPLVFMVALDRNKQQAMNIQTGVEYSYQNKGMIRLGLDRKSGFSFGAGTTYKQFQLDYAYGKLAESGFGGSHRFSFTIRFGKSREELLEIAERKRRTEIGEQVAQEQLLERKRNITRFLEEGRTLYENGDYWGAKLKFSQVLDLDSLNIEAEDMYEESDKRNKEILENEMTASMARIQEQRERDETRNFVTARLDEGQDYLRAGDYHSAIEQFERALERQPNSPSIKDMIDRTREQLNDKITGYIERADNLSRNGNYQDAIRILGEAQLLSRRGDGRYGEINHRISELEKKVNLFDFYQRGVIEYRAENWAGALENFENARQIDPNYSDLASFYREAERRVNAKEEAMTPEMEKRFSEGYILYIDDHIQEAIDIWEELLEIQPYNKEIIDLIDKARKQLEQQKRINR
jgi:tetratricopeptide (TPR) repeat protein